MQSPFISVLCLVCFMAGGLYAENNPALARLRREADKALKVTPGSVMDKTRIWYGYLGRPQILMRDGRPA